MDAAPVGGAHRLSFLPQSFLPQRCGPLASNQAIVPGKQLLSVAARYSGMSTESYINLVTSALGIGAGATAALPERLEQALSPHPPPRFAAVTTVSAMS